MINFMKLNPKDFKKYKNNGVIRVKKVFSRSEIINLKKNIDLYIKKNTKILKGKEINFIQDQVNSIHLFKDVFFKKFSNQSKILELGKFFLKDKPKIRHFEYFAKPKKIGLPSPMHQDNYYWNLSNPNSFTIWIAIDKATKKNGAVEYLLGSHKRLYSHVPSYAPGSSQKVKEIVKLKNKFKTKSFNLNSGDCLIHHSQIIHGSKKNSSNNSRKGFTVQVMTTSSKVNKEKFKKYQASLKKQIELRST